jgi:hypothetical protein
MQIAPFDNLSALSVFRDLDPNDWMEAILSRGAECDHLQLWAEWWAAQPLAALSLVIRAPSGRPIAVLMVARIPGQAGVAVAAMLARPHDRHRATLARAMRDIRRGLPGWAEDEGIARIEARSWAGHPGAGRFLRGCGFAFEAALSGFGPGGNQTFHQYAWTRKDPDHV